MNSKMLLAGFGCALFVCASALFAQTQESLQPTEPKRPYTISKETTYFTGPLKPNGSIDFIAAVNAHFSQGVTPENNAARIIVPLISANFWFSLEHRDQVLAYFEIEPQRQATHNEFVELYTFAEGNSIEFDAINKQLGEARSRTWKSDEFPQLARWLQNNTQVLESVRAATSIKHYYVPLVGDDQTGSVLTASSYLDDVSFLRRLGTVYAIQCNNYLAKGEWESAWREILIIKRLEHWLARGQTWIHLIDSLALAELANQSAKRFLNAAKDARVDWNAVMASWPEEPAANWGDVYCITDRAAMLQLICQIWDEPNKTIWIAGIEQCKPFVVLHELYSVPAEKSIAVSDTSADDERRRNAAFVDRMREMILVDDLKLDALMRFANSFYDRAMNAAIANGYSQQMAIAEPLETDTYAFFEEVRKAREVKILDDRLEDRTILLAKLLLGLDFPTVETNVKRQSATIASNKLIKLGLAARTLQSQTGQLPRSLQELGSCAKSTDLNQPFDDEPFGFQTTDNGILIYHWNRNGKNDGGQIDGDYPKDWGIRIEK